MAIDSKGRHPLSIWQRKADMLYLFFFTIHIPIMLSVDIAPYYPSAFRPAYTVRLIDFHVATNRDRFFIDPPLWFHAYIVLEAVYHIPLTLWAIRALIIDHPLVPLHLLVFASVVGITTLTCTVEMLSWEGYSRADQMRLAGLYVPYLLFAIGMGADMFSRAAIQLMAKSDVKNKKL